jgi:hypothetical protein
VEFFKEFPYYDLYTTNCQHFAQFLVKRVCSTPSLPPNFREKIQQSIFAKVHEGSSAWSPQLTDQLLARPFQAKIPGAYPISEDSTSLQSYSSDDDEASNINLFKMFSATPDEKSDPRDSSHIVKVEFKKVVVNAQRHQIGTYEMGLSYNVRLPEKLVTDVEHFFDNLVSYSCLVAMRQRDPLGLFSHRLASFRTSISNFETNVLKYIHLHGLNHSTSWKWNELVLELVAT